MMSGAKALDALGALAVLGIDLPLVFLDPDASPALSAARLVVAVSAASAVLLVRRRTPLVLLAIAVVDVLLRHVGSYALGWAAYAVARHERDGWRAAAALAVAALVSLKVWTWTSPEIALAHVLVVVVFMAVPVMAGIVTRHLPGRADPPPPAWPDLAAGLAELDRAPWRQRG